MLKKLLRVCLSGSIAISIVFASSNASELNIYQDGPLIDLLINEEGQRECEEIGKVIRRKSQALAPNSLFSKSNISSDACYWLTSEIRLYCIEEFNRYLQESNGVSELDILKSKGESFKQCLKMAAFIVTEKIEATIGNEQKELALLRSVLDIAEKNTVQASVRK